MATPFVSGVIALMLEADPSLGVDDTLTGGLLPHQKVRNILASTAEHRGAPVPNNEYGYGVIDAYSAVAEALGVAGYVPNAYPGYTILTGEGVADLGNWTHEFTVTADLVGMPISGTATIDGTFVEGCLFWFGNVCVIPSNLWSPDLEVILEKQQPSGSWSQVVAGAGEVTFSECPARGECGQVGRAEVVHFTPQGEGTFRFRVFPANDESNQGVGGNFDFEISIGAPAPGTGGNITPLAGFTFVCTGLTCNFTDTSGDVDGSVVSWNWDFGDGNSSTAQNPSHTYASGNTYSVTLTVTDDQLATANVTKTVVAPPPSNIPPTANFSFSTSDLTANFADTSSDSDGTIVSWSWTFGDGGTSSAANPSHAYAAAGTYDVTLIVTDDDSAASTGVTKSVTVTDPVPNVPPVASFVVDVVDPNPCGTDFFPNTCQFTDTSTDSDGNVVSLDWDFDGGSVVGGFPIGPGESLLVQFPATGPNPVTVRLTVTDNDGATHFAERTLPISHPAPPPASVHIADLDNMSALASRGRWDAAVSVLVRDDHGTAISGATINGAWSNGTSGTGSCDTDANGQCMITKPNLKVNVSLVTFSVTSIVSTGLEYTGTANSDPDGDSDGTAINLAQPGTSTSQPPVASFTVDQNPCGTDFFPNTCLFTDTSTDADGDIVSWSWDFGDGQPVVAQGPHLVQFPDDGPNPVTVTLTVTDGTGATDTTSLTLPISDPVVPPPTALVLEPATGYKVKGVQTVDLVWSGGPAGNVEIHRNGVNVQTTPNDGAQTHNIGVKGPGSYIFEICEAGGAPCSNAITVIY
jgi:PKD repeat protein